MEGFKLDMHETLLVNLVTFMKSYMYVIAWVAVKFGINTMSAVYELEMGQIS